MFSSTELVSFVFANEHDIYYGKDLLKRNLNQYLWTLLHENYKAVYFLSASDGMFDVRSFGDLAASTYQVEQSGMAAKIWKFLRDATEREEFEEWLLRQLCRKSGDGAAFVCSMEDFCDVMSRKEWRPFLERIAGESRCTGMFVLTASATAERTRELLLHSPVFEWIHETAVTDLRAGAIREMYGSLKHRKWDNCLFLNEFTPERTGNLLVHILMEYPDRCLDAQAMTALADYLAVYLNDPCMQWEMPLVELGVPMSYLSHRELYELLKNESVWNRLLEQQEAYIQKHPVPPVKAPCQDVPILRDRSGYAGQCMLLKLPHWMDRETQREHSAAQMLRRIQHEVSVPKNRLENTTISGAASGFISQIDTVSPHDLDTYHQILSAVDFCVRWVYTEPEDQKMSRIGEILEKLHSSITLSQQCFHLGQDLELFRLQCVSGVLQRSRMEQMEHQLHILTDTRQKYVDLVNASVLELTMPASSGSIMEALSQLEQQIEICEKEAAQAAVMEPFPGEVVPQEPEPSHIDDNYNFVFRPEDLIYIPPK